MQRQQLVDLIKGTLDVKKRVDPDNPNEIALNLYFYRFAAALYGPDSYEFYDHLEPDEVTVRKGHGNRLRQEMAQKVVEILEAEKIEPLWLQIIVYGMVRRGSKPTSFVIMIDTDCAVGVASIK